MRVKKEKDKKKLTAIKSQRKRDVKIRKKFFSFPYSPQKAGVEFDLLFVKVKTKRSMPASPYISS